MTDMTQKRPGAGARVLAALALLVCGTALYLVLSAPAPGERAPRPALVELADVARHPGRYAGQEVTVRGRTATSGYLGAADADAALAVDGGARYRVLALPSAEAAPRRPVPAGKEVRITGVVRRPEPPRPSSGERRDLSASGIAAQVGATALIRASRLDIARPASERAGARVRRTTVRRFLRRPQVRRGGLVAVSGRAYRLGPRGFVLAGRRRSVFVAAPARAFRTVDSGERIRVRGRPARISPFRAHVISAALRRTSDRGGASPGGVALGRTPSRRGRPMLVLSELLGAEG